jgi:hypothetical protein
LIDTSDNFSKSLKPIFQLPVQQVTNGAKGATAAARSGGSGTAAPVASNVKSGPAEKLTTIMMAITSAQIRDGIALARTSTAMAQ